MATHEDKLAKLATLREQLASATGEPLFDRVHEEAKAQVRHRALLLLDQRARSRAELDTRLARLEFESGLIQEVLDDLERSGLIDDYAFASEWVRQRHQLRGKSRRALSQELDAKGISADIKDEALQQVSEEDESEIAITLAVKKARTIRTQPTDRKDYDKHLRRIVGMLARRGYGESLSYRVAKRALDDRLTEIGKE
ncbi:Regulatory protein RecX [Corynebacterium kalinowskii]|uniref:Regulatory protein RecX n=1 Tax=Corynebacterium kalinowskii TaxID=2675216 RepID=A0A6B8VTY1_9CORY|nr:regulatory protein RecX [Corynebacterium kalinowskii]QGU02226.1 Regulatory protein RecX [Corynebacterium kalinowskii]